MWGGKRLIKTLMPAVLALVAVAGLTLFAHWQTPKSAVASAGPQEPIAPMIRVEESPASPVSLPVALAGVVLLGVILCSRLLPRLEGDCRKGSSAE